MRVLCFLFLVIFAGAVVLFAAENRQDVTITFYDWSRTFNLAEVIGAAFALGMLSGWSIVGMLRRSYNRMVEEPPNRQYAAR